MARRALVVAVVCGCGFEPGPAIHDPGSGSSTPDARASVSPDASAGDAASTADAPWAWTLVETVTIQTASTTAASSMTTFASGVTYRLRVSGSFTCTTYGAPADAEYWIDTNTSPTTPLDTAPTMNGSVDFGLAIDDLSVNSTKTPHWGAYASNHIYEALYTGRGQPLQALLYDSQYNNNSGTLKLEIYAHD